MIALQEMIAHVSYKPGWALRATEDPNSLGFFLTAIYDGYESVNAVPLPVAEEAAQVTSVRVRLGKSDGKTVRNPEKRYFRKYFETDTVERMKPREILRHVIAQTIREAEMFECERWLKLDGGRVFEEEELVGR